jgi:signal transduction histidine kinase
LALAGGYNGRTYLALKAGREAAKEPSGSTPGGQAMIARRRTAPPLKQRLRWTLPLLALLLSPLIATAGAENVRRVLVLCPSNDRQPGNLLFEQGLRTTFAASPTEHVEIYNEYLDSARFSDDRHQGQLAHYLRRKYADIKIDVVIPWLAPSLDFALKYRQELFPTTPIVFGAIEERQLKDRDLGPGVVGVPMTMDMVPTLEVALRLHPGTRRVVVIAGASSTDTYWEAQARQAFRRYEDKAEFVYLSALPLDDVLKEVAQLSEGSIVYYLHIMKDGAGHTFAPAEVAERIAAAAKVPVYGHVGSYLGRGIVGGRLMSFEKEGENAARLALRVMAGEKAESIPIPATSGNDYEFDARQLRRWGIREADLPSGSVVRYREPTFWDLYTWHVTVVIAVCVIGLSLILGFLMQRFYRRRAENGWRDSQCELRALAGRLIQAEEAERRRIARELHDDLNQRLALLAVELDLLGQAPPASGAQLGERLGELSAQVKEVSSAVHELSHNLHPSKLEQLGLVAAVRGLCKEQAQAHNLDVEFTHRGMLPELSADTALCLYRIVQEALGNVVKHSQARHAGVELSANEQEVSLRIVDDGTGFDPQAMNSNEGLGLVSMRERLRLVGGTIVIDSRPSAGTRINVRAPAGANGDGLNSSPGQVLQPHASGL